MKLGNLKDPEKIAAKLAEAEANHRSDFFEAAALYAMTGRVIAIGLLTVAERVRTAGSEGQPHPGEFRVIAHEDEATMLREFWGVCQRTIGRRQEMIGFNILQFDLPFLVRRSWRHRVPVPAMIRNGRYWSGGFVDLRERWQLGDRHARGSLEAVARHVGAGIKNGKGGDFAYLWANDRARALEYLRNDLQLTAGVGAALGVV